MRITRIYNYDNAEICVMSLDSYDRNGFKKATANFVRRVIKERNTHGNTNTSGNF